MQKLAKRLSVIMALVMTFAIFAGQGMLAKAATVYPQVQYVTEPKLEYEPGDIVNFDLHTPNYGGRVQYRVVLWDNNTKSMVDLWKTPDRYYTNWMPYGNETFNLHWKIEQPGSYRITIYVKRAGITNNETYLKGFNCDSYMESDAFVVKAKAAEETPAQKAGIASLAAVNANLVQVAFQNDQATVSKDDYKIAGVEISNVVYKQDDKKTVLISTKSELDPAKEYAVSFKGTEIGKVKGSSIKAASVVLVERSNSRRIGNMYDVQALVKDAAGKPVENIPVTFNIVDTSVLNPVKIQEVLTDKNGIATLTSFTRYARGEDDVVAYATGNPSALRGTGRLYWGVTDRLSVDVTDAANLYNRSSKIYNVTAEANQTICVMFAENLNNVAGSSTLDDSTATVTNLLVNGPAVTPFQNTNHQLIYTAKADGNGKASFVVSGLNTSATPIVYVASDLVNYRYNPTDLQVKLPNIAFAGYQSKFNMSFDITTPVNAASGTVNAKYYELTVLMADNKTPYAGGTVTIAFDQNEDNNFMTNIPASIKFVDIQSGTLISGDQKIINATLDKDGKFWFAVGATLGTEINVTATPCAWIDLNDVNAVQGTREIGEPQVVAGPVIFNQAFAVNGTLGIRHNGTNASLAGRAAGVRSTGYTLNYRFAILNQSDVVSSVAGFNRVTWTILNDSAAPVIYDYTLAGMTNEANGTTGSFTLAAGASVTVAGLANGYVPATLLTPAYGGTSEVYLQLTPRAIASDVVTGKVTVNAYGVIVRKTINDLPVNDNMTLTGGPSSATFHNTYVLANGDDLSGKIVGFNNRSTAGVNNGYFIVECDGRAGLYAYVPYYYGTYKINGNSVTVDVFEEALSVGDSIVIENYTLLDNLGATRPTKFALVNADNSADNYTDTNATIVSTTVANVAAAAAVDTLIGALDPTAADFAVKVAAARSAYDGLTAEQKALVTKLANLQAAEATVAANAAAAAAKAVADGLTAINGVHNDVEMMNALIAHGTALGLNMTKFNVLSLTDKLVVANFVRIQAPAAGYGTAAEVKAQFDLVVK